MPDFSGTELNVGRSLAGAAITIPVKSCAVSRLAPKEGRLAGRPDRIAVRVVHVPGRGWRDGCGRGLRGDGGGDGRSAWP